MQHTDLVRGNQVDFGASEESRYWKTKENSKVDLLLTLARYINMKFGFI